MDLFVTTDAPAAPAVGPAMSPALADLMKMLDCAAPSGAEHGQAVWGVPALGLSLEHPSSPLPGLEGFDLPMAPAPEPTLEQRVAERVPDSVLKAERGRWDAWKRTNTAGWSKEALEALKTLRRKAQGRRYAADQRTKRTVAKAGTDQANAALKLDNARLREENARLRRELARYGFG